MTGPDAVALAVGDIATRRRPRAWRRLVRNGMAQDFSWNREGPHYEALFSRLAAS